MSRGRNGVGIPQAHPPDVAGDMVDDGLDPWIDINCLIEFIPFLTHFSNILSQDRRRNDRRHHVGRRGR